MFAPGAFKSGGETFDGKLASIAEDWTQERLHDAHAYTHLSKSVSDFNFYKYHKNIGVLLKALPLALPQFLGLMNFPGKSAISILSSFSVGQISLPSRFPVYIGYICVCFCFSLLLPVC